MNVRPMDVPAVGSQAPTARQTMDGIQPETAVAVFGILSGVGGAASQLIAGHQLSGRAGPVGISEMAVPLGVSILGAVTGAFLVPGDATAASGVARSSSLT